MRTQASLFAVTPDPYGPADPLAPNPLAAGKKNPLAVTSMVLGIAACIPYLGFLTGITAVVLGAVALSQLKKNPEQTGRGMAITGIVTGIVFMIVWIGLIAVGLWFIGMCADDPDDPLCADFPQDATEVVATPHAWAPTPQSWNAWFPAAAAWG